MQPTIFLFDLDGVLVQPGGYRAALRATVNYLTNQLGLGDLAPDDDTVAIFEAQGVTSEWDMIPVLLAAILDAAAAQAPGEVRLESLRSAQDWLAGRPLPALRVEYPPILRRLGEFVEAGRAPSESILDACQNGRAADLFPRLAGSGVLNELFSNTRRIDGSRITALFEIFAVGDVMYEKTTGLAAEVRSESLLERYDRPLLAPAVRERLLALRQAEEFRFAAYTARPSAHVRQPAVKMAAYAPEAELALGLIGIQPFPLMGAGQMCAVAAALGENEERLIKPAPYHALAAVAAAWTGDCLAALDWMKAVFQSNERREDGLPPPSLATPAGRLPEKAALHIFEDSPAGMRGGSHAAAMLGALGMQVDLRLWGVSDHPEKAAALQAVGARVYADVNQAVQAALE